MSAAAVVYRSHTGTTRQMAEEIATHLRSCGVDAKVSSVGECDFSTLAGMDFLLLGCWTNGWFVVHQHPDEPWLAFVRDMPKLDHVRVGLFTTYRLVTGSMFARMREKLVGKVPPAELELKSRGAGLSNADRAALDRFIGAVVG
jgi:flavodoxin